MKSYTITVNGNVYDVTVEENGGAVKAPAAPKAAPKAPATPKAAPKTLREQEIYVSRQEQPERYLKSRPLWGRRSKGETQLSSLRP